MYLFSVPKDSTNGQFFCKEFEKEWPRNPVLWMRYFFPFHHWILDNLKKFGFEKSSIEFNMVPCRLDLSRLNQMQNDIHNLDYLQDTSKNKDENLCGFLEEFDKGIELARKEIEKGKEIYFLSWW